MNYAFVDCRWSLDDPCWGRREYLAGHVPGAAFLDVEQDLSAPPGPGGRHPLPGAAEFARAAGRAGIGPGVFVIAYGSLGETLDALEADHAFLTKGGVFSEELIRTWIAWKRENEVDVVRLRPHPAEFFLYYDA